MKAVWNVVWKGVAALMLAGIAINVIQFILVMMTGDEALASNLSAYIGCGLLLWLGREFFPKLVTDTTG